MGGVMRLKNKNTGEIGFLRVKLGIFNGVEKFEVELASDEKMRFPYGSLAELNEGWEDYEEPKEFWYIGQEGVIFSDIDTITQDYADRLQEIGNYFETKEEAEKAVEKLKAWKRLKDKGFKFTGWDRHPDFPGDFRITASDEWNCDDKDLDLLFGGEE